MILVTGVSGFIGKHLLNFLVQKIGKENIIALTSKPINECQFLLHNNYNFDEDYFTQNGFDSIETILHAGAFTPKNQQEASNTELCYSNIYTTHKLLKSSFPKLKKIIFLSTLDVYENIGIITENSQEKPLSLYGHSKLFCEKLIENWGMKNEIFVQILRIGHVYGPGEETYQKIIPSTIQKILRNSSPEIWGSGEDVRSFIFVKDVVEAIYNSINLEKKIGVINITSGNSITINELIKLILKISNKNLEIKKIDTKSISRNLFFDNSKMMIHLLKKETQLEYGLKQEIDYMTNL